MTEPRALTAALQAPAFVTRGGGAALHAANRHVERWAPEAGASRFRPLANLGFVDRLVTPWIESAQRSASLRMFSQVVSDGVAERAPANVSWVFPRPWYQDELDWMAAARQVGARTAMEQPAPSMLTTRGTFVAPAQAMPRELHEYVAPSLSLARPDVATLGDAYSPLVPFAATQAAHVMARAVAPIGAVTSPGLRAVLSTLLARTTIADEIGPTRTSLYAPELVTPPAPRAATRKVDATDATQVADRYAEQHDRVAELQRLARQAAERELAARQQATAASSQAALDEVRAAQARAVEQRQAEIQRRLADAGARRPSEPTGDATAERARVEERIAQRLAAIKQQESVRLHEHSREAAARDARQAAIASDAVASASAREVVGESRPESRVPAEIAAAVSALPPELASMVTATIGERPERAVQAIAELGDALRSVELIARTTAAGGTFEPTRGPRVVMPAGLGGLVAMVARTSPEGVVAQRMPMVPFAQPIASAAARAAAPTSALAAATSAKPAALTHVAWSDRWLARLAGARPQSLEVLAMASSPELHGRVLATASAAPSAVFVAPMFEDRSARPGPRGELGFDVGFSGDVAPTTSRGLDEPLPTLRGGPAPAQPAVRFDDDAETPDDMLAAIAMAATRSRASAAASAAAPVTPTPSTPALPTIDLERYQPRATLADLLAQAVPSAPGAGLAAALASSPFAPALRHVLSLGSAPTFDVRALFGGGLSSTYLDGLLAAATTEITAASVIDAPALGALEPAMREVPDLELPFVTLRSALLSADIETTAAIDMASGVAGAPGADAAARVPAQASLARTIVDAITLPMLADSAVRDPAGEIAMTYAAPGMLAERAESWSVAQERSSADLSFDFVPPELVLAARVYGLGPAEAAQAARLAVVGAGQLSAMASAVDRTFVQALSIEAERRGERARLVTAYPIAAGDTAQAPIGASTAETAALAQLAPAASAFGVERRAPRGAFLWPSATTAALGLQAASPHGEQGISVAALELLAAQAVAEFGTYAALDEHPQLGGEHPRLGGVSRDSLASGTTAITEARDEDVLASANALVPESRREKFQALYVALRHSPAGRTASPAARAARALALAGRGDDTVSARERATIAWDVLPVVFGLADAPADEPLSSGDAAAREMRRRDELRAIDPVLVDARPGLGGLSARAGEALGAYVAPVAAAAALPSSSSSSGRESGEVGAVLRAPTAAQELVRTGGGRFGGGEVEIPTWFEAAAKKMFEERSGSVAENISIAELTLIAATPARQVAASAREATGNAAPVAPSPAPSGGEQAQQVDIEKLANDVYREVLVLMDLARARNGEPYL